MCRRQSDRRGYTLLEVLLASAIAVIMMAALYVAIQVQLQQMEEGRNLVERSSLARSLFQRMSNDLTSSLSPIVPSNTSPPTNPADPSSSMMTTTATQLNFQIGVKGDNAHVAIYQTRIGRALINPQPDKNGNQPPPSSDIRRICYFMTPDRGLARQDIYVATSDQVDDTPIDLDEY